jgi:hypothetical protein
MTDYCRRIFQERRNFQKYDIKNGDYHGPKYHVVRKPGRELKNGDMVAGMELKWIGEGESNFYDVETAIISNLHVTPGKRVYLTFTQTRIESPRIPPSVYTNTNFLFHKDNNFLWVVERIENETDGQAPPLGTWCDLVNCKESQSCVT